MGFVGSILLLLLKIALGIIACMLFVNLVETVNLLRRCFQAKTEQCRKRLFKELFFNYVHKGPFNLIKWVICDVLRGKNYFKLFGIWCFTGYYGEGKSLGEVNFAFNLKKKHPEMDIKIYSNFNVVGQDGKITGWEDILHLPKNTILLFDEIQSTFTSTKFKDFPLELLWKLTQCRKHGLAIFCTSPVYNRMTIQLRESCDYVIECHNVFHLDRYFRYVFFRADKYEQYNNASGLLAGMRKREYIDFTHSFVARDIDYSLYDTTEQIDRFDVVEEEPKKGKSNVNLAAIENSVYKRVMNEIEKRGGLRSA